MDKKKDKFIEFCNECDWSEETIGLPYHFCPKCGHINIGFTIKKKEDKSICNCDKEVDLDNLSENFKYVGCDEENNPVFRCKECNIDVYG